MTKNNTPAPKDPNEVAATNAGETFSSSGAVTSGNAPRAVKNKWLIPGVAFASAALLAGALGFALGSNNSQDMNPVAQDMNPVAQDMNPVAMSGQAFGQNNRPIPCPLYIPACRLETSPWLKQRPNSMGPIRPGQFGFEPTRPGQFGFEPTRPGQFGFEPTRPGQFGFEPTRPGQFGFEPTRPGFMGKQNSYPNQNPAPTNSSSPTAQ